MTPAEGLTLAPAKTPMAGCPKLARLRILKASARNCKFHLSLMGIFLNIDMSNSIRLGPRNWLRPAFPNVPAVGSRKALGLNHWLGVPKITGPLKAGFRLGTSGLAISPFPERFEPTVGVKRKPVWAVTILYTIPLPAANQLIHRSAGRPAPVFAPSERQLIANVAVELVLDAERCRPFAQSQIIGIHDVGWRAQIEISVELGIDVQNLTEGVIRFKAKSMTWPD